MVVSQMEAIAIVNSTVALFLLNRSSHENALNVLYTPPMNIWINMRWSMIQTNNHNKYIQLVKVFECAHEFISSHTHHVQILHCMKKKTTCEKDEWLVAMLVVCSFDVTWNSFLFCGFIWNRAYSVIYISKVCVRESRCQNFSHKE